jgi:RimJ/RimL family protein N-acetyltransferase
VPPSPSTELAEAEVGRHGEMIETGRLMLRPFEQSDAEAAFWWFGDAAVIKYVPKGADSSLGQTRRRIAKSLSQNPDLRASRVRTPITSLARGLQCFERVIPPFRTA